MRELLQGSWGQLVEPLVTFGCLIATWLLYRTNRWLAKHLELERSRYDRHMSARSEREFRRQNETVKTLSDSYARGEPPTLDDLLSSAERDWSLRSSVTPYETPRSKRTGRPSIPPHEPDNEYQDEPTRESITRASPPSSRRK